MVDVKKLNMNDILQLNKLSFMPGELESNRSNIIAHTILENESDLVLGFAIQEKGQLESVLQLIEDKGIKITKVFYDGGKRKRNAINEYKEKYKLYSNWMDYPPEFVINQYAEFDEKVEIIKEEAKVNRVEMEAI